MGKLYWKIFFSIWMTMVLVIGATAFMSDYFLKQRLIPLRNSAFLSAYATAAVMSYEAEGMTGLKFWLDELYQNTGIQAFLITEEGTSITQDSMTDQMQEVRAQLSTNFLPNTSFRENNILVSKSVSAENGSRYRLLADVPDPESYLAGEPLSLLWMRILLAIGMTGLICYVLSRYLAAPILKLKSATRRFGAGELGVRVSKKMGRRWDEIGELGLVFDRMAEQIEALVEGQKRLLQDVSHELRTPLARLQVALELARRRTQGLAKAELDRIELESQRLNALIGEIISLVRLDSMEIDLNAAIDMTALIQDVIEDTNYEFKPFKKSVHLEASESFWIKGNETLLRRAFENIIRNALRYTKPETLVEVSLQKVNRTKNQLIIRIADQGKGVPEAELEHLFKPFYRVESSRKDDAGGGYGLGLAIVKKAIHLHHGKVSASNRQSGGLMVEVILPLED